MELSGAGNAIARMEEDDEAAIMEQDAAELYGGVDEEVEEIPVAPPLQHSLPMQLNLDPSRMLAMHGSLFPAQGQQASSLDATVVTAAATSKNGIPHTPSSGMKARHVWKRPAVGPVTTSAGGEPK